MPPELLPNPAAAAAARLDNTQPDHGGYRIKTESDLLGGQLGLDLAQPMGRWTFVGKFKGGLYANFADSRTTLMNSGTLQFDNEADKTAFAASIELGYHAMYALTPNVSLRAGYDSWWIYGLAIAPEQDISGATPCREPGWMPKGTYSFTGLLPEWKWCGRVAHPASRHADVLIPYPLAAWTGSFHTGCKIGIFS